MDGWQVIAEVADVETGVYWMTARQYLKEMSRSIDITKGPGLVFQRGTLIFWRVRILSVPVS